MNLELSGTQWLYEDLSQALTPGAQRYKILMMDTANLAYAQAVATKLKQLEVSVGTSLRALETTTASLMSTPRFIG